MSTTNSTSEVNPRVATKQSVDKALELIRGKAKKPAKRKRDDGEEYRTKVERYCAANLMENYRRQSTISSGFSHSYAIPEMYNALMTNDWSAMHEMFPSLLICCHAQPIVWRYAFIIYLCSPFSDQYQFQEFIEMCMGLQLTENPDYLKLLMTLNDEDES